MKILKFLFIVALSALSFLTVSTAFAEDGGLYGAAPSVGSAFIRIINASPTAQTVSIRGKEFHAAPNAAIGPYIPVAPPSQAKISIGSISIDATLKPTAHYDAVFAKGKLTLLEEPANDDPLKVPVILINASALKNIALKVADGSVSVIPPTQPGALGARAVNPIKVSFAIYAGDKKIAALAPRLLERRHRYAIIVYDDPAGEPKVNDDQSGE